MFTNCKLNTKSLIHIADTIKDGNLGTNPVSKYSLNTGIPRIKDVIKHIKAIILKNKLGLYSLNNLAIVFNTLNPSENVFNFDTLPAGLSLYSTGISFNKKFLSSA